MWCLHGLNDPTMSIFIMIIITRGSAAWLVVVYLYFLRVWWRLMLVSFVYHDRSTDYWLPKCIILPANLIVRLLTAVDRTRDYLAGRFAWWWLPGIIYYLALFMPRYPIDGFEHYVLFFTWWLGRYYISYWRPRGDINYAACVPAYYAVFCAICTICLELSASRIPDYDIIEGEYSSFVPMICAICTAAQLIISYAGEDDRYALLL